MRGLGTDGSLINFWNGPVRAEGEDRFRGDRRADHGEAPPGSRDRRAHRVRPHRGRGRRAGAGREGQNHRRPTGTRRSDPCSCGLAGPGVGAGRAGRHRDLPAAAVGRPRAGLCPDRVRRHRQRHVQAVGAGPPVEPTSKADTIRVLEEIGVPAPSLRTIWRTLASRIEDNWRATACRAAYSFAAAKGSPPGCRSCSRT